MTPRRPLERPREPQEVPREAERASKGRPRVAQEDPRPTLGGPKTAQRRSQVASNSLLICIQKPTYVKTLPRGAQEVPEGPKGPSRALQGAPQEPPKRLPRGIQRLSRGTHKRPQQPSSSGPQSIRTFHRTIKRPGGMRGAL